MHHRRPAAPHSHRPNHRQINRLMPFTTAPLFHALQLLETGDSARFHMPGHKGEPVFNTYADIFAIDFTETYGTGNLYTGEGPIRDAEVAAARYFDSEDCFFLTGGSTQGADKVGTQSLAVSVNVDGKTMAKAVFPHIDTLQGTAAARNNA